jgi:choline-sulfatase
LIRFLLLTSVLACQAADPVQEAPPTQEPELVSDPSPGPVAPPPTTSESSLPPILLLTLDTTRADHLGFYGYFRDTSPNLDHLASMSLVFDDAIAPMATTLPTHLSLMTGLTPLEHGTTANIMHGGTRFVPGAQVQTIAQVLAAAGYQTAAFVSATPLESGTGVERGFADFNDPEGTERAGDKTVNRAIQWLHRVDLSRPWFLWVHLYDPHNPYWPMEPWKTQFVGQGDQASWLAERQFPESSVRPGEPGPGSVAGQVVETVPANDRYDGEIAFMDAQIGRLMLEIARTRVKPVILVLGDHGEGLGQHDQPGHGRVWNEQLRVPMMLHSPGLEAGRFAPTVGVVDAIPTLLGQLEIPGAEAFLSQASGVDMLGSEVAPRVVYSLQSTRQEEEFGQPRTSALTTTRWKLISAENEEPRLYHRGEDPHELSPAPGAEREPLLQSLYARQLQRAASLGQPVVETVSDETLQALKELGYVE